MEVEDGVDLNNFEVGSTPSQPAQPQPSPQPTPQAFPQFGFPFPFPQLQQLFPPGGQFFQVPVGAWPPQVPQPGAQPGAPQPGQAGIPQPAQPGVPQPGQPGIPAQPGVPTQSRAQIIFSNENGVQRVAQFNLQPGQPFNLNTFLGYEQKFYYFYFPNPYSQAFAQMGVPMPAGINPFQVGNDFAIEGGGNFQDILNQLFMQHNP